MKEEEDDDDDEEQERQRERGRSLSLMRSFAHAVEVACEDDCNMHSPSRHLRTSPSCYSMQFVEVVVVLVVFGRIVHAIAHRAQIPVCPAHCDRSDFIPVRTLIICPTCAQTYAVCGNWLAALTIVCGCQVGANCMTTSRNKRCGTATICTVRDYYMKKSVKMKKRRKVPVLG